MMKLKFLSIFLILVTCTYYILKHEEKNKVDNVLVTKTKKFSILYDAIYTQYKEEAKLIFITILTKDKITNIYNKLQTANKETKDNLRKELYTFLEKDYKALKFMSLRQLHFHLKNNESFLRMHRPKKFGDDLTSIRPTIAYVNKNVKPIDGFEEGRIFNGFRFVFPIKDGDVHLGSVEVSFSADIIVTKLLKDFNYHTNLHIRKDIVDEKVFKSEKSNYINSPIDGYVLDKEVLYKIATTLQNFKKLKKPSLDTRDKIKQAVLNYKQVSIFDKELKKVITILPIKNPITKKDIAFVSVKSDAKDVININKEFRIIFSLIVLLILVSLYFIYKQMLLR